MDTLDTDIKNLLTRIEVSVSKLEKAEETVVNASQLYERHSTDPLAHPNMAWLITREADEERISEVQLVLSELESQIANILNRIINIEKDIIQINDRIRQKHGE